MLIWGDDNGLPETVIGREKPITDVLMSATGAKPSRDINETLAQAMRSDASPETETKLTLFTPEPAPETPGATPVPAAQQAAQQGVQVIKAGFGTENTTATEPAPPPEPEPDLLYVSGSRVNVRGGPSTAYGVIASLSYGTAVEDLGDASRGWRAIKLIDTGERGYMAGRFLVTEAP